MTGLMAIFWKELADNLYSKRFIVLFLIMYAGGIAAIYVAAQNIRESLLSAGDTPFIFIRLFILSGENMPFSFPFFLSLFVPILGMALGFDAINSERASGNLSRILSQPVYRDSVINGKFLAGLATISILVITIFMVVGGLGLRMIGVPPTAEELLRLFTFVFITIVFGAFWLAMANLFSVLLHRGATSLIASIAIWLFLFFFLGMLANGIASSMVPITDSSSIELISKWDSIYSPIMHISPITLYGETVQSLLMPDMQNVTARLMMMYGDYSSSLVPLPMRESLISVWPQMVTLIALSAICFAISYIRFMREEVRAT